MLMLVLQYKCVLEVTTLYLNGDMQFTFCDGSNVSTEETKQSCGTYNTEGGFWLYGISNKQCKCYMRYWYRKSARGSKSCYSSILMAC